MRSSDGGAAVAGIEHRPWDLFARDGLRVHLEYAGGCERILMVSVTPCLQKAERPLTGLFELPPGSTPCRRSSSSTLIGLCCINAGDALPRPGVKKFALCPCSSAAGFQLR